MAIVPSKECKCVGDEACAMPWCHGVASFEVKTSRFWNMFHDNGRDRGGSKRSLFHGDFQCVTQD